MAIEAFPATRAVTERWRTLRNDLRACAALPTLDAAAPNALFFCGDVHLVFFPPAWFKHAGQQPASNVQYVGGIAQPPSSRPPEWLAAIPGDRPLVTVTQTTGFGYGGELMPTVLEALDSLDCEALIIGPTAHQPPASAERIHWVTGLTIARFCPRTSVFLHHGGMGTTHAAVCHGVPQVITPPGRRSVHPRRACDGLWRRHVAFPAAGQRPQPALIAPGDP
jgi:UDP:flavonoid glycosyltransferase YjiC (YdhE family)